MKCTLKWSLVVVLIAYLLSAFSQLWGCKFLMWMAFILKFEGTIALMYDEQVTGHQLNRKLLMLCTCSLSARNLFTRVYRWDPKVPIGPSHIPVKYHIFLETKDSFGLKVWGKFVLDWPEHAVHKRSGHLPDLPLLNPGSRREWKPDLHCNFICMVSINSHCIQNIIKMQTSTS